MYMVELDSFWIYQCRTWFILDLPVSNLCHLGFTSVELDSFWMYHCRSWFIFDISMRILSHFGHTRPLTYRLQWQLGEAADGSIRAVRSWEVADGSHVISKSETRRVGGSCEDLSFQCVLCSVSDVRFVWEWHRDVKHAAVVACSTRDRCIG